MFCFTISSTNSFCASLLPSFCTCCYSASQKCTKLVTCPTHLPVFLCPLLFATSALEQHHLHWAWKGILKRLDPAVKDWKQIRSSWFQKEPHRDNPYSSSKGLPRRRSVRPGSGFQYTTHRNLKKDNTTFKIFLLFDNYAFFGTALNSQS